MIDEFVFLATNTHDKQDLVMIFIGELLNSISTLLSALQNSTTATET